MSDGDEHDPGPTHLSIILDGDGRFGWWQHHRIRHGRITHVSALPNGTSGGRASMLVVGKLKDGSYAALETTLRLGIQALAALQARYGLEADGHSPAALNEATRQRLNAAMLVKLIADREGSEVTFNIDELNAVMQGTQDVEQQFGEDGKTITFRIGRSE